VGDFRWFVSALVPSVPSELLTHARVLVRFFPTFTLHPKQSARKAQPTGIALKYVRRPEEDFSYGTRGTAGDFRQLQIQQLRCEFC